MQGIVDMKLDHKKFFDGFKAHFDDTLDQGRADGIEFLLTSFENDERWAADVRFIAYALATIFHETAGSMRPVEEGYYLARYGLSRVKSFQKSLRYYPFFGRGYVQLTWNTKRIPNYSKASKALGIDFVKNPDLVMVKENAFQIMTLGMFEGWFTAKKLSDYVHGSTCDYKNARKIINGLDKAVLIAGYAVKFEKILKDSAVASSEQTDQTAAETEAGSIASTLDTGSPSIDKPPTSDDVIPTSPPDKTDVVIEKEPDVTETKPKGILGALWQKVTGALGGGVTADVAIEKAQQAQALGLSERTWTFIFWAVIAGLTIWIVYHFVVLKVLPWGQWFLGRIRTNQLVAGNATADSVQVIAADKLAEYEAKGYTVIKRS